jgi:hypothetical protein
MDASHQAEERDSELTRVREGDGQEYLDRSKLDFDPDDGLYTGTVVDGTTEIPGPHVNDQPSHDQPAPAQDEQPEPD